MLHGLDAEGVDAEAAEVVRRIARALADEAPRQGTPAPVPSGGGARGTTCLSCFAFGRSAVPATVRKVESMMTRMTGKRGERGRRGRGRERGGARRGGGARRERGEASKRVAQRQQQQRVLWLRCRAAIGPPRLRQSSVAQLRETRELSGGFGSPTGILLATERLLPQPIAQTRLAPRHLSRETPRCGREVQVRMRHVGSCPIASGLERKRASVRAASASPTAAAAARELLAALVSRCHHSNPRPRTRAP